MQQTKWLIIFLVGIALATIFTLLIKPNNQLANNHPNTPSNKHSNIMQYQSPITIDTQDKPNFAIIWLHGLGANGNDFVPVVPELNVDDMAIRFIFPHAPIRPVTVNMGHQMPAWYDIKGVDISDKEDIEGMSESQRYLDQLIDETIASGIASENILLAGFSQGGAVASYTFIRSEHKLAGCMALSTYVPFPQNSKEEKTDKNMASPVFWGHGNADTVVPLSLGEQSVNHLKVLGYRVEMRTYAMEHSVNMQEIADIGAWIRRAFRR